MALNTDANLRHTADPLQPAIPLGALLAVLFGVAVIALAATVALPAWLPQISQSLLSDKPKAFWYLSRASAFAAFGLMWLSMMFGLLVTNKLARVWPGGLTAFDLHQYASLLGLVFIIFHACILLGDRFINYTLIQIVVPFGSLNYRPEWVGLGQIALYLTVLVSLTFYARRLITQRGFRIIHYLSYLAFLLALVHGLWSGTDNAAIWARGVYWFCGGSTLFFTVYRILSNWVATSASSAAVFSSGR